MLITLLAQFGLGVWSNLFISIPEHHPGAGEHNYFIATGRGIAWLEDNQYAPVVVATHAGVGVTLVVISLWVAVQSIRTRKRPTISWLAILGALSIIAAAVNGGGFLDYNNDVYSFLMAMFFAAAVTCYVLLLALPSGRPMAIASTGEDGATPVPEVNEAGAA
jgi:hypothetical protein